jgi:hypothetical protein
MTTPVYTFRDARMRSPLLGVVNGLGNGLAAVGLTLPNTSVASVVKAAQAKSNTQLEPDAPTLEALRRYIASAQSDAQLNTLGRVAVHNMLVNALASNFAVLDWHRQHGALAQERIEKPWVIIGLPRTGTSILSILLGLDPLNRPILQWEARHPIPPATLAGASEDPRIASVSIEYAQMDKLNPAIATMHPFGSTLAEECTALFMYSLRTIGLETIAFTPSYGNWLDTADMEPAFEIHRKTLQAWQAAQPTGHWVLKSPNHLWCLPELLAAYPDARIVWTHRNPAQVLPSLASLNCAMQNPFTRQLDPKRVGSHWAEKIEHAIDAATQFDTGQARDWCHHVQYEDLVKNPVTTLRALYARFDARPSALHERRVATWLAQKPQHADGIHAYDPADFGWTEQSLRNRFKTYQDHYVTTAQNPPDSD